MLTCITCSKQKDDEDDGEEEGARETTTPSTKESVKSLTAQIKDMALKMSGSYKQSKQHSPNIYKRGNRHYPEFDTISEGVPYSYGQQAGSSSSTPAWDVGSKSRFNRPFHSDDRISSVVLESDLILDEHDEPKEWMAQVEPGVQITFVSLPTGGNDLKRIRFSRETFDKWQAQRWWGENLDRIMELYNVQRFNKQALNTPGRSEVDENRDSTYSRFGSVRDSPMMTPSLQQKDYNRNYYHKGEHSMDPSRTTTSSRDEPSISASNASEVDSEWVEQDEPGVYITIRQLVDGTRELRRVRFSRERFGERNAKTWWDENRERIQAQYL